MNKNPAMACLKADFHIHTAEDQKDLVRYSALELIDMAREKGFSCLAITNHDICTWTEYLRDYAKERGICLLPGMEATIQGRHVLLINFDFRNLPSISTFEDLYRIRRQDALIIAPHPFYPSLVALRKKFIKHIGLFDAAEWSHFFCKRINFNIKMEKTSKRAGLPIIGTSDAHQRKQFDTTYTLVDAETPEPGAVVQAVRRGRVEVVTRPLPLLRLLEINVKMALRNKIIKRLGSKK